MFVYEIWPTHKLATILYHPTTKTTTDSLFYIQFFIQLQKNHFYPMLTIIAIIISL